MPGFNFMPPPGPAFDFNPQMALAAFRPPPPMVMPGMAPMQQPQGGGGGDPMGGIMGGLGMLAGGLGKGLSGLGVSPAGPQGSGTGGAYTPQDAGGMAAGAGLPGLGGLGMGGLDDASLMTMGGPLGGMPGMSQQNGFAQALRYIKGLF